MDATFITKPGNYTLAHRKTEPTGNYYQVTWKVEGVENTLYSERLYRANTNEEFNAELEAKLALWKGKTITAEIIIHEYNGREYLKIKSYQMADQLPTIALTKMHYVIIQAEAKEQGITMSERLTDILNEWNHTPHAKADQDKPSADTPQDTQGLKTRREQTATEDVPF